MKRTIILAIALAVTGIIVTGAILVSEPRIPTELPTSTGIVTAYEGERILVEELPGEQSGDKCWFAITDATTVYAYEQTRLARIDVGDLTVGRKVQAWAGGPVLESYPCQTSAKAVLILE